MSIINDQIGHDVSFAPFIPFWLLVEQSFGILWIFWGMFSIDIYKKTFFVKIRYLKRHCSWKCGPSYFFLYIDVSHFTARWRIHPTVSSPTTNQFEDKLNSEPNFKLTNCCCYLWRELKGIWTFCYGFKVDLHCAQTNTHELTSVSPVCSVDSLVQLTTVSLNPSGRFHSDPALSDGRGWTSELRPQPHSESLRVHSWKVWEYK